MTLLKAMTLSVAVAAAGQSAAAQTLVMGNEGDYPPFSITQADGTLTGFEPTLARALCDKLGAECEIQAMEFSGLIPSLVTGKIDMIVSQLFPNPERAGAVDLTDPVIANPETWILPAGSDEEITASWLSGKSIGVIRGAWNVAALAEYAPDASLRQYDNLGAIKLDLEAGRIDVATAGIYAALANFQEGDDAANWTLVPPEGDLVGNAQYTWAVQKGNTELLSQVNAALEEMFADCTYTEIRKEYFSVRTSPREPDSCQ